ncbi:hypothetical protein K469DRAFT_693591 [Zopfia rhizophila CBS 207.26]|uniref:Uncharacterized protein n=1 Tax=Zopfia rhizophila CBS 207.26 TaxID=1314779 RepID=A0A6A6DQD0_9PEZI|nr:hypothetical protein K469DRAFT_693591 [Zopfia rhizophila CBS 207.26]
MSNESESSTPYTVDNWLDDAGVVLSVWNKVENEIEFPELKEVIKKRGKMDADEVLENTEPDDRKRVKIYVVKVTNKLRESGDLIGDFTTLLERFRNGPQNTKPKEWMLGQENFRGVGNETGNYFNWRN